MKNPCSILITGASSGLGEALAKHYSAPGRLLALTGRNANNLSLVANHCKKRGADVIFDTIDVSNSIAMQSFIDCVEKRKPIELVIANAGISYSTASASENLQYKELEIISVNLCGVLNTVAPIIKTMKLRNKGQVAIISSLAAYIPIPGASVYSSTKAAVKNLGLALRTENSKSGVSVTVICPGYIHSRMTKLIDKTPLIMSAKKSAEVIARKLERKPAKIIFPFTLFLAVLFIKFIPSPIQNFFFKTLIVERS